MNSIHLPLTGQNAGAPEMPQPLIRYHERGFIMIRQEAHAFCDDPTEALVFRVIESLIEAFQHRWHERAQEFVKQGKPAPRTPKTWWIGLTYEQILAYLYGIVSDVKTVGKRILNLIKNGILRRRPNPANTNGAFQYTINAKAVQKKIDALHENRNPSYGSVTNQGVEPDEISFDASEIENALQNHENRNPSYGSVTNQGVEPDEHDSEGAKNETAIRPTDDAPPQNHENRNPSYGYSSNSSNRRLRNNGKDSSSSQPTTTTPASSGKTFDSEAPHPPYQQGYGGSAPHPPLTLSFTEAGQAFYDLFCQQSYVIIHPEVTDKTISECNTLGIYVKTVEQINSLHDKALSILPPTAKNTYIYPKNMQTALNAWKQDQKPKSVPPPKPSYALSPEEMERRKAKGAEVRAKFERMMQEDEEKRERMQLNG